MPKFKPGDRVIGVFFESALEGVLESVKDEPDSLGRDHVVRYDAIPSRTYMMKEDKLTSVEELFT